MPWRETTDPYKILLSEIILQQTQVCQGLAYYERFLKKYPTINDLAAASQDEVMQLWQGLGYYSRARNLHAASKQVVELGHFPTTHAEILKLKGVGSYTAAAIASFAYNLPHAAIDGNAYRVLSRYFAIDTPIDTNCGKKQFETLAHEVLDTHRPALFNQAMMDLGATCCTPKSPQCHRCPLSDACLAHANNSASCYPVKQNKIKLQTRRLIFVAIHTNTHLLLQRRDTGDIWQGLYQPTLIELPQNETDFTISNITDHQDIKSYFTQKSNDAAPPTLRMLFSNYKHRLTHRLLLTDAYALKVTNLHPLPPGYIEVPLNDLHQYGVPKIVQLIFNEIQQRNQES